MKTNTLELKGGPVGDSVEVSIDGQRLNGVVAVHLEAKMKHLVSAQIELRSDIDVQLAIHELEVIMPGGKFITHSEIARRASTEPEGDEG